MKSAKLISTGWEILVANAIDLKHSHARNCSRRAHALMSQEIEKFVMQTPPADEGELYIRYCQSSALTCIKVGHIAYGDGLAKKHPRVADEIFAEIGKLCGLPLPASVDELKAQYRVASRATSRVTQICWRDR